MSVEILRCAVCGLEGDVDDVPTSAGHDVVRDPETGAFQTSTRDNIAARRFPDGAFVGACTGHDPELVVTALRLIERTLGPEEVPPT